jgi:hypothetical protein
LVKVMPINYEAPHYIIFYILPFYPVWINHRKIIWQRVTTMKLVSCLLKFFHFPVSPRPTSPPEPKCFPHRLVSNCYAVPMPHRTAGAMRPAVVYYLNLWILINRTRGESDGRSILLIASLKVT